MAQIYLETSFISACVTDRTDIGSVYRRQISQEWWITQKSYHSLYVSAEVLAELSHPKYPLSHLSLDFIHQIPILPITDEVRGLANILVKEKVMPQPIAGDSIHIAVATIYRMDFVLTWNVRHLANPNKQKHLQSICLRFGFIPPQIITPDLLWENNYDSF